MEKMSSLTFPDGSTYEVVDDTARSNINTLNTTKANTDYVDYKADDVWSKVESRVNDMFYIKTVNKDGIEVASNGTTDVQIYINLEANERLVGLAGYNVSNASEGGYGGSYGTIYKIYPDSDGELYNVSIRNLNTSKGLTIRVYLYLIVAKDLD